MRTALVMVILDALGLIACLVVLGLYRQDLPPEALTLLTTVASLFGLCLRDAHQYEFGSSRGSREKTALLGGAVGAPSNELRVHPSPVKWGPPPRAE